MWKSINVYVCVRCEVSVIKAVARSGERRRRTIHDCTGSLAKIMKMSLTGSLQF